MDFEIGGQLAGEDGIVFEREFLGVFIEEEIERIDDGQFRDQIDLDGKLARFLGEYQASQAIAVGILLPIDEMVLGVDAQGIAKDGGAGVGGRPQPNDVGGEPGIAGETVIGFMI